MIERRADTLYVSEAFNQLSATKVLAEGEVQVKAGVLRINLAAAQSPDSAALAVLLGWQRSARAEGRVLQFDEVPQALVSLAELYGVAPMLFAPVEA